jgi:hypothetical protein
MGVPNELDWGYSTHRPDEQRRPQSITEPRPEGQLTLGRFTAGRRAPSALRLHGLVHEINRGEVQHTAYLRIPAGPPQSETVHRNGVAPRFPFVALAMLPIVLIAATSARAQVAPMGEELACADIGEWDIDIPMWKETRHGGGGSPGILWMEVGYHQDRKSNHPSSNVSGTMDNHTSPFGWGNHVACVEGP